jgi:hypothetical protein
VILPEPDGKHVRGDPEDDTMAIPKRELRKRIPTALHESETLNRLKNL